MIERVVENWLARAGERTYQVAFCHMLASQGHTVIHLTRHCAMELGKDVITLAPDGKACAFQLKGGDIGLKAWREEVGPQVEDLVTGRLVHPSLNDGLSFRPYLVTNGRIEEEVQRLIDDKNESWKRIGYPPLEVLTHGQLYAWARDLGTALWPSELTDTKLLLELHLWNGREVYPKARLARLLESIFPFDLESGKPPSKQKCSRAIASGALLTSLTLANFVQEENHVAEAEAWIVFIAYTLALAERWSLPATNYAQEVDVARRAALNALERMVEEVREQRHFDEPGLEDGFVYSTRITWAIGLASAVALVERLDMTSNREATSGSTLDFDLAKYVLDLAHSYRRTMLLWGEAAVPQFLAYYWLWRIQDATIAPMGMLFSLVEAIAEANAPRSGKALPNPYYEATDLLPHFADHQLSQFLPSELRLTKSPLGESFAGEAYSLEGIYQLTVRSLFKQFAIRTWPSVSKIARLSYQPEHLWHLYFWRNPDRGKNVTVIPEPTRSWAELRALSEDSSGDEVPPLLRSDPGLALLFLLVYPHRISASYLRWLDKVIKQNTR